LLAFPLLISNDKNRFAKFLITLPSIPLGIGLRFNHMIKKRAKQIISQTQVQVRNNGKKQKRLPDRGLLWTMLPSTAIVFLINIFASIAKLYLHQLKCF